MAYDKDKYQKLRSLEVPHNLALALANDESPIGSADPENSVTPTGALITQVQPTEMNLLDEGGLTSGELETIVLIMAEKLNQVIEAGQNSNLFNASSGGGGL